MKTLVRDIKMIIRNSIANIMTFLNLSFGCFAILFIIQENYFPAAILILLGTILDRFDGKIARKLQTTSLFGKELDSLADLVTFGLAPAILIWRISLHQLPIYGTLITLIYILSGAYRLARYNSSESDNIFVGIPITIAGGLTGLLSLIIMRYDVHILIVGLLTILFSYCMVTTKIKIMKR